MSFENHKSPLYKIIKTKDNRGQKKSIFKILIEHWGCRIMIKKMIVGIVAVLMVIFATGCLDYKTYNDSGSEAQNSDDLVNEIAQIENELGLAEENKESEGPGEVVEEENTEEVVEEVILSDLEQEEVQSDVPVEVKVKENELVSLKVKVVDPDQDQVSYSFSKPLEANGQWKTNYGDAGEYFVTITATDGKLTTEKNVKITVERVNVPPVISQSIDMVVKEGALIEFTPNVVDPNKDPLTVTVSEPLKEGAFKTDHTSAGEYQIRITATDGELASESSFKLTVENVNELPVISNVENLVVKEGETITLEPLVTDLDEDEITLTISDPVGDDGVWETSFTNHGEYFVTITADDGKDQVRQKIRVVVEDINMPPEILEVSLASS